MRLCGNCDFNDGCVYTSLPPKYKCTLTGAFHFGNEPCDIDFVPIVRCGKCRHYQGNHDVPGCAPCDFWGIGAVMWDDFCKRGEMWDG